MGNNFPIYPSIETATKEPFFIGGGAGRSRTDLHGFAIKGARHAKPPPHRLTQCALAALNATIAPDWATSSPSGPSWLMGLEPKECVPQRYTHSPRHEGKTPT